MGKYSILFNLTEVVTSIIMSFGIIIAVLQLKQPYDKKIIGKFTLTIPIDLGDLYYCINICNTGMRNVKIESIYIKGIKKNIFFSGMISEDSINKNKKITEILKPDDSFNYFIKKEKFDNMLKKQVEDKVINGNKKMKVIIKDQADKTFIIKSRAKIKKMISY